MATANREVLLHTHNSAVQSKRWNQNALCLVSCLVVFFLALGRYWVFFDPTDKVPDNPESFRTALHIAEDGKFADPFVPLDTGPSAHLAPAFPALLALFIRMYGFGPNAMYAIKWTATIVLCLQLALFPLFSRILGMGVLEGVVGALFWIAAKVGLGLPPNHQAVAMFGWESFYAAILAAIAVCCFRRYLDLPPNSSLALVFAIGSSAGVLALLCPTVMSLFAAAIAWLVWRDRLSFFRGKEILLILLPAMITGPWFVRNYIVFHRLIPVRDNFGLELSVSNNDCAHFGLRQNMDAGCFEELHPNASLNEAKKVLQDGEPEYNQLQMHEAVQWIVHNPGRFAKLSLMRFVVFWLPTETRFFFGPGRRLERFAIFGMTLLSVPALVMLYGKDPRSAAVCFWCLALFPLVYYLTQYEYRYRYPILWITFLLGAYAIVRGAERMFQALRAPRRVAL